MDWTSIIITLITTAATIITVILQTKKTATKTQQLMEVNDYKTYLLVLLSSYPLKVDEILSVGRHYFEGLGGDSFLLPLFDEWLECRGISDGNKPEWFLEARANHPRA